MAGKQSKSLYLQGLRDGVPIGLGYFAVSFALGIFAKKAGLSAFQGFLASLLNNASAGEYAGFTQIMAHAALWEIALITLITNARYLLMSTALSQKIRPETPLWQRLIIAFDVTDEIFGALIAREGPVEPKYYYGVISAALPGWSVGTAVGIIAGSVLPASVVSALSVALYGMFLAVIIPPAKKNPVVAALVVISFALSFACGYIPLVKEWSEGTKIIVLTVVISAAAALIFPVKDAAGTEDG